MESQVYYKFFKEIKENQGFRGFILNSIQCRSCFLESMKEGKSEGEGEGARVRMVAEENYPASQFPKNVISIGYSLLLFLFLK